MAQYTIELSDADLEKLTALAKQRNITASEVISQAIGTEKLIADNVGEDDDLLIKQGSNFKKFTFAKAK